MSPASSFVALPVLLVVLVVCALGLAVDWLIAKEARDRSEGLVQQRASELSKVLSGSLLAQVRAIRELARSPVLQRLDDPASVRTELQWLKDNSQTLAWIGLVAPDGKVVAGSDGWLEGASIADRPVFRNATQGLYIGDFHRAVALSRLMKDDGSVELVDVSLPILDAQGRLVAVLACHLDSRWFTRLVETAVGVDGKTLGLTANVLVDQPARLLVTSANQSTLMLDVPTGAPTERKIGKRDVLVATDDVALGNPPLLHWRAVAAQDMTVALAPVHDLRQTVALVGLVAAAAFAFVGYLAARRMTQHWGRLFDAVERRFDEVGGRRHMPLGAYVGVLSDELTAGVSGFASIPAMPFEKRGMAEELLARLATDARQLKRALDHLPMGVVVCDPEFRIEYVNPTYTRMLGWSLDGSKGQRNAEQLLDVADAEAFASQFRKMADPPGELAARFHARCADGSQLPVEWHMVPLFGNDGRFDGAITLLHDISGEINARRHATDLMQRLRVFAEVAVDYALVTMDAAGRVVSWNRGATTLHGYANEQALGMDHERLFAPSERERGVPAQVLADATHDGQVRVQCWRMRADGSRFWSEGTVYRLPVSEDSARFASITLDMTDMHVAQRQLAESEARLSAVIANANDAIVSTDADGRIELFNPAAEQIFGCEASTMLGQPLERLPPSARTLYAAHHTLLSIPFSPAWRATGTGRIGGLRADGEHIDLEVSVSQATVGARKVRTAILRDITERVRDERALADYRNELQALSQRLLQQEKESSRRLAQALHDDLGQTLATIRLTFDVWKLRHSALPDAAGDPMLDRLERQIDAANVQVRQVLVDLRPALLDEEGLAAALASDFGRLGQMEGDVPLSFEVPPGLANQRWPADVEYAAFMVVREAAHNAVKHAKATKITVSMLGMDDWLTVTVRDDGVGIAPERRGGRPGHLGLVGMRERATAIAAGLKIESEPGRGTVVSLHWPMDKTDTTVGDKESPIDEPHLLDR